MSEGNEIGDDPSELDEEAIHLAARSAVAYALWVKKRLGLSAVVWEDGRIVVIPPEEIKVDEDLLKHHGKPYIVD